MSDTSDSVNVSQVSQAEATEVTVEKIDKPAKQRPRNYSFIKKNPINFDEATDEGGNTYLIPANVGSTYWAILKVMYENANKPISENDLPDLVSALMEERSPDEWESYKNKDKTTVFFKEDGHKEVKQAQDWRVRICNNAKTLTRIGGQSPYGQRLRERGHGMEYYKQNGSLNFILHTDVSKMKKQK
jgi:hypothetical protein